MLAISLNGAVGRGAILLGVLVCIFGIGVTITGIRQNNARALVASARYAWVAGAAAVVGDTRITEQELAVLQGRAPAPAR